MRRCVGTPVLRAVPVRIVTDPHVHAIQQVILRLVEVSDIDAESVIGSVIAGDLVPKRHGGIEEGVRDALRIGKNAGTRVERQGQSNVRETVGRSTRPADRVGQGNEHLRRIDRPIKWMFAALECSDAEPPCTRIERIDDQPYTSRQPRGRRGAIGHLVRAVRAPVGLLRGPGQDTGVRAEAETAGERAQKLVGVGPHAPERRFETQPCALLHPEAHGVQRGAVLVEHDGRGKLEAGSRIDGKTKAVGHGSRRPKSGVGFGDDETAEEGPAMIPGRGNACKDSLVREQRHPVRAAFDPRFIGTDSAGNSEREPMLDRLSRRKRESER